MTFFLKGWIVKGSWDLRGEGEGGGQIPSKEAVHTTGGSYTCSIIIIR